MIDAIKSIGEFLTANWRFLLFAMHLVVIIILIIMLVDFLRERNRSDQILIPRAIAEFEAEELRKESEKEVKNAEKKRVAPPEKGRRTDRF